MAGENETRRAAAICENCGTAHSVRIDPEGEIRPIGTGQGTECTCGNDVFQLLSDDSDLVTDVESETERSAE